MKANELDNMSSENWAHVWERARRKEVAREEWVWRRIEAHRLGVTPECVPPSQHDSNAPGDHHRCGPGHLQDTRDLGHDNEWDFEIGRCSCGRVYLVARLDNEDGRSGTGRWYMARFQSEAMAHKFNPKTLRKVIGRHEKVMNGGSYWRHSGKWFELDPVGQPGSPLGRDLK